MTQIIGTLSQTIGLHCKYCWKVTIFLHLIHPIYFQDFISKFFKTHLTITIPIKFLDFLFGILLAHFRPLLHLSDSDFAIAILIAQIEGLTKTLKGQKKATKEDIGCLVRPLCKILLRPLLHLS